MKKHFWWMSVALWLPLQAAAQDGRFHSPVDIPFLMSGSFGEPRPNHFHCGIDVKTQGVVGKRVLSVCDGYVSRLTVGYDGFGNAVYVTHPNGLVIRLLPFERVRSGLEGGCPQVSVQRRDGAGRREASTRRVSRKGGGFDCLQR